MSKQASHDAGHQQGMLAGRPPQQRPWEFVTVPRGDSYKFEASFGAPLATAPSASTWPAVRVLAWAVWSAHVQSSALSSTQPGATR